MKDHRDSTGINLMLSSEDRDYYKAVILSVYPSKGKFKGDLHHMSDRHLMGFAGRLIKSGEANFQRPQIYLRALRQVMGAHTWVMDETSKDGFRFYFAHIKKGTATEIGSVTVDKSFVIQKCVIHGIHRTRFTGMLLRSPELT